MHKGYVHIYMGENWKDLNTAQGMAARACGAGLRVCFYDFIDDGRLCGFADRLTNVCIQRVEKSPQALKVAVEDAGRYDMIVLYGCDFLDDENLRDFLTDRPKHVEVVLCGTGFSKEITEPVDLVSEIVIWIPS